MMRFANRHRQRPGRHRWLGGDRGSGTGWAIGTIMVGLLLAGLIFDGGAAMTAKAQAWGVAQQAARAGADELDLVLLRATGEVRLDPAAAEAAAAAWLHQAGLPGTVVATTEQVSVTVTITRSAVLLAAIGITSYDLTATATAEPVQT